MRSKKMDLYSKYRENKLQALTKTDKRSAVQICTIAFAMS